MEKIICPICKKNDEKIIAKKVKPGIYQNIVICKTCGLVYLNPRWDKYRYDRYYKREYYYNSSDQLKPKKKIISTQEKRGKFILEFIKGMIDLQEESKVLEVGCGAGGILYTLKSLVGCQVFGIEPSKNWDDHLKKIGVQKVYNSSLENYELEMTFDCIILSHVFEHFLEFDVVCNKLKTLLNDHGLIYIEVPNIKNIKPNYPLEKSFFRIAHPFSFSSETLRAVLGENGFTVKKIDESNFAIKVLINKEKSSKAKTTKIEASNYSETLKYLHKYKYIIYPLNVLRRNIISILAFVRLKQPLKAILKKI